MNYLSSLIEKLCPDGVEFTPLWSVTIWDKKFNSVDKKKQPKVISYPYLLAKDMFALEQENGDVFLLSTGEQTGWTTEDIAGDFLCEGEVVSIPWGKSRKVSEVMKYYKGKFVTADNRIATSYDTTILLNKYLYYWMMSQGEQIDSFYRGSGLKHPSMKDVLDMNIPLPPLAVQQEIVRILDSFTALTAELTVELTARRKQYEYYRDELLCDCGSNGTEHIQIKNLFRRLKGTPITAGKMKEIEDSNGEIRIFAGGKTIINAKEKDIPNANITRVPAVLVQSRGVIDVVYYDRPFTFKNEMWAYTADNVTTVKYLYYVLKNNVQKFRAAASGMGSLPQISLPVTEDFYISIPALEVQKKHVQILDRFDALCNNLTSGLPAEIAARQKQYEYYRDKLLTFKELKT